jgi:hypothetical protein
MHSLSIAFAIAKQPRQPNLVFYNTTFLKKLSSMSDCLLDSGVAFEARLVKQRV